ncbi:MAG: adenine phosphoribosyltransferase [Candidatus Omnitrophica bacterium]|nr:adenine phosphoribosyltransferase [Candidatus Omnitrophota bacterium]
MNKLNDKEVKNFVRDIPDFPKKGIVFKDITPLLKHPVVFRHILDEMVNALKDLNIRYVVGIESRGFIFSPVLAYRLGAGFIPVRKKGKLPYQTEEISYQLEYGEATLEIHKDAIESGARVIVVDDLLATGGTALAAAELVEKLGGQVARIVFLVELLFLKGREKLSKYDIFSLIQF